MAGAAGPMGAFDGLYSAGTAAGTADAQDAAQAILPHSAVLTTPSTKLAAFQTPSAPNTAGTGVVAGFIDKVGAMFKEGGNLLTDAVKDVGKSAVTAVEAPVKLADATFDFAKDEYDYESANNQINSLKSQQTNLMSSYSSGRISTAQYTASLKQLAEDMTKATQQREDSFLKVDKDSTAGVSADINTEGDILTVLTAGIINPAETTAIADTGTNAAIRFMTGEGSSVGAFLTKSGSAIDSVLGKIPGISDEAVSNSLSRQFLKSTSDTITDAASSQGLGSVQIAKSVATALVLRRPIVFNYLVGQGKQVYDDLSDDKYGSAVKDIALNSAMMLSGGPIGWAFGHIGTAFKGGVDRVFGQTSFADELSKYIGDGNPQGLYNVLSKPEHDDWAQGFKALEATNLQATHGNVIAAVQRVTSAYDGSNLQLLKEMDHESVAKDMFETYTDQRSIVGDLIKSGAEESEAKRAVVGRWSIGDNQKLQAMLEQADKGVSETHFEDSGYTSILDARTAARRNVIQTLQNAKGRNSAWLNNDYLQNQLDRVISTTENTQKMKDAIDDIPTGVADSRVSNKTQKMLAEHGHIAIVPEKNDVPYIPYESLSADKNSLTSEFAPKGSNDSIFKQSVQPLPVLGSVGKLLTAAGLSAVDAGSTVMKMFNENLTEQLGSTIGDGTPQYAEKLMQQLADYVKNPTASFLKTHNIPITDYRQMTLSDIREALGVDVGKARDVRNALMSSMLKVPLDVRGLGDRVMDLNYKYNPVAKYYSRIQGATRYVFNPFFNWQKATQTEFLAQFEAGGKTLTYGPMGGLLRAVMPNQYAQIDSTIDMLNARGILGSTRGDDLAIGRLGEGDFDQSVGKVGTKLLKGEQQSLASLVMTMADKVNMSPEEFVDNHYDATIDALRTIVSYGKESSVLNSPLARTLNFAFFPMRYNLKISGMMAKYVQKLSAPMQVVFIHSALQFSSFLKSDEGMAWYAQNADIIQLFQYISPLYSLDYLNQIFNNPKSISSYGSLGGLPFGFITQGLDAAGITHFNSAYVSSENGDAIPTYIPANSRGQINVAIQDLLGQLFTYPGATAGLPSKSGILKKVGTGLTGGSSTDLKPETEPLSGQQQQYQQVVQNLRGTSSTTKPNGTAFTAFDGPAINSINIPTTSSTSSEEAGTSSASKPTKLKKAQFTPQLLPGQSYLGESP